jgi:Ras-related protein Rab-4B
MEQPPEILVVVEDSQGGVPDYVLKFIVIGDASVGKSCVLHQFVENEFKRGPPKHTIGVEFGSKTLFLGGERVKLQIWDTAGQERFRSVCHSYYRGATGALLVYDITDEESFDNLPRWLDDVRALAGPHVSIVLCGNKADLESERKVELLEASRFAQEQNAMFLETSALTGQNVPEVFHMCARTVLSKLHSGEINSLGLVPQEPSRKLVSDSKRNESFCYC